MSSPVITCQDRESEGENGEGDVSGALVATCHHLSLPVNEATSGIRTPNPRFTKAVPERRRQRTSKDLHPTPANLLSRLLRAGDRPETRPKCRSIWVTDPLGARAKGRRKTGQAPRALRFEEGYVWDPRRDSAVNRFGRAGERVREVRRFRETRPGARAQPSSKQRARATPKPPESGPETRKTRGSYLGALC